MAAPAHHRLHEASRGFTGPHGGAGHHEASLGLMAAQGFTGPHGGAGHHEASLGLMAAQDITGPHGGAGHHGASLGSLDLATRGNLATALATPLVAGFSSNSYVFL